MACVSCLASYHVDGLFYELNDFYHIFPMFEILFSLSNIRDDPSPNDESRFPFMLSSYYP